MTKILIMGKNFGSVSDKDFDYFLSKGYEIAINPYKGRMPTDEEFGGIVPGVDGMVLGVEKLNARVLEHADRLKVVCKFGVGVDNIDIPAATAKGVAVCNIPGANTHSVADLTMGLMLDISKLITYNNRRVMSGMWPADRGHDIAGKTLGIIGFGRIGQEVAKRARGFGMKLLAHDPFFNEAAAKELGVAKSTVDEITEQSDYITLHIPKTPESTNLFDAARIARMKKGSYLVNCARGGIVDEDALYDALRSGHLAGAALDVLVDEPPKTRPKLFDCDNCIVTSHSGGNSQEAILLTARLAADNIIAVLEGRPCPNTLNAKELNLPT